MTEYFTVQATCYGSEEKTYEVSLDLQSEYQRLVEQGIEPDLWAFIQVGLNNQTIREV